MNRSSRSSEMPADLPESITRQLNMYVVAASAAGVGMLALVQPAEAKIVYTPTHQVTSRNNPVFIDLNHDGINDFELTTYFADGSSSFIEGVNASQVPLTGANRIVGTGYYPLALRAGVSVGPKKQFGQLARKMAREYFPKNTHRTTTFRGHWANDGKGVKNRYLGLKVVIKGKVHYGWARVTVTFPVNNIPVATLTGYAYETIPNKAIIAGKTKGPGGMHDNVEQRNSSSLAAPTPEPATLGFLALGSSGLSIWRREESAAAQ